MTFGRDACRSATVGRRDFHDDFCPRFDIPINEVGKNQQPIRIPHVFLVNGGMHLFKCGLLKIPEFRLKRI
jgi:hypothetical protein